jgi:hypothetical protein
MGLKSLKSLTLTNGYPNNKNNNNKNKKNNKVKSKPLELFEFVSWRDWIKRATVTVEKYVLSPQAHK